jgi:Fe-S cluster biogenesis protein NfuA
VSLVKKLKNIFAGSEPETEEDDSTRAVDAEVSASEASVETAEVPDNFPNLPKERRVIKASIIAGNANSQPSDEILIKAQPSATGDQCIFMVNRTLMEGHSWFFANFENAAESPLAEALFSLDDVETALVLGSTLTVTRKDKTIVDWRPLAKDVGAAVRGVLEQGGALIAEKIIQELPTEASIREGIQKVIDVEVNPGVAGHGGNVTLLDVKGNTVTIQMGGGCQGCSAADLTLKQGIHTSFRNAVPKVGAILDETDHSAGVNPYFS